LLLLLLRKTPVTYKLKFLIYQGLKSITFPSHFQNSAQTTNQKAQPKAKDLNDDIVRDPKLHADMSNVEDLMSRVHHVDGKILHIGDHLNIITMKILVKKISKPFLANSPLLTTLPVVLSLRGTLKEWGNI
jgi:hypothetical protein